MNFSMAAAATSREMLPWSTQKEREWKLFQEAMAEGIVEVLPLVVLLEPAFSPVLAMARDYILGFVQLEEDMIGRAVERRWCAIAR